MVKVMLKYICTSITTGMIAGQTRVMIGLLSIITSSGHFVFPVFRFYNVIEPCEVSIKLHVLEALSSVWNITGNILRVFI